MGTEIQLSSSFLPSSLSSFCFFLLMGFVFFFLDKIPSSSFEGLIWQIFVPILFMRSRERVDGFKVHPKQLALEHRPCLNP